MDLSIAGYFFVPITLIWLFHLITRKEWLQRVQVYFLRFLLLLTVVVLLGNIFLYRYWGTMLNYRALTYLSDPIEVISSLSVLQLSLTLLLLPAVVWALSLLFRRMVPARMPDVVPAPQWLSAYTALQLGFSILAIRGGLQINPMNESLVYFSADVNSNSAAVNPVWHLAYDTFHALSDNENPYTCMDPVATEKTLSQFRLHQHDTSESILDVERPNVVVLLLESFTADIVGEMKGDTGVTPFLDSLIRNGLFFDSIYSSGFRTDQGIASVLNGWPATPYHSIIRFVEKCRKLPSLPHQFAGAGYAVSYYYGGESNFSNMNAYLLEQGISRLVDINSFGSDAVRGQWGVHDEEVLLRQAADMSQTKQPFFSMVMTLSNHEPFDVPGPAKFNGTSAPDRFRNSAYYTDKSLRTYFEAARKTEWYDRTLFILVADHAHELPRHRYVLFPEGRHIPLLFYGPALTDSSAGKRCHKIGGHHDIASTLLPQIGMDANGYAWSKNLLAPEALSFAYLPFENYLTWISPDGWFLRSTAGDRFIAKTKGLKDLKGSQQDRFSRALMQEHYEQYLRY